MAKLRMLGGERSQLPPLVVDLDNTLIKTDLLYEAVNKLFPRRIDLALPALGWLAKGRLELKHQLADRIQLAAAALPYNPNVIELLNEEKAAGRRLVLATASPRLWADQVAAHLGFFDEVLASDSETNLKSGNKRDALVEKYGAAGFDYVGDSSADLKVWQVARVAYIASDSKRLGNKAAQLNPNIEVVGSGRQLNPIVAFAKALRLHQWVKNLLIFVPLFTAHSYTELAQVQHALLAFVAFSLTASAVYLINDLADVWHDRHHAQKRFRPFAQGELPLALGWFVWPVLLAAATLISLQLPGMFLLVLAVYFFSTLAYSFYLKRKPIADGITLAMLYTLRLFAGITAIEVPPSFWLTAFSMFFFFGLALVKRYSELISSTDLDETAQLRGRGYRPSDLSLVEMLGISASFISAMVMALYINDSSTVAQYRVPEFLWPTVPALIFWISRVWLKTHRAEMQDDPIVFAIKDRVSWAVLALVIFTFALAKWWIW